jgi:hypothetical protein
MKRLVAGALMLPLACFIGYILVGLWRNPEMRPAVIVLAVVGLAFAGFWILVSEETSR